MSLRASLERGLVEPNENQASWQRARWEMYALGVGYGVGDVGPVVLRYRQSMAKDGIVVAILQLEHETGKLAGKVELVSRGFVFMKQSQDLFGEAQKLVEEYLYKQSATADLRKTRDEIAGKLQDFFFRRTNRNPMILPVIIEI